MATTFTLISTVTVGSGGAASIDFTSIPATYTDLCLKISVRTAYVAVDNNFAIRFNSATTNYSLRGLYGTGSAAGSFARSSPDRMDIGYADGSTATASTFANIEVYIPNYAGANYKSASSDGVAESNASAVDMGMFAVLWSNTAAITDIKLIDYNSSTISQYSSASLYGILKA
jgi:hypothetical protein